MTIYVGSKKRKPAGHRYKAVERVRRRKETIAKSKESQIVLSQQRLLSTPFWPDFDPERAGMKVSVIEWLDDDDDIKVSFYPGDVMVNNLFSLGMSGNMMAVFLLAVRESDETGYVKRVRVFEEIQRLRQCTQAAASKMLALMLPKLRLAGLLEYKRLAVYINPAYAYKGDRGKAARTLRRPANNNED